jgi:hypothetical protein
MSYLETINALILHHRGLAEKLEKGRNNEVPENIRLKFEQSGELMKNYEFKLVRKER